MKTVSAIIAVLIIIGAGVFVLVKHNDKNKSSSTLSNSSYSTSSNKAPSSSTQSSNAASTPATSGSAAVTISNFAFDKADLTVTKGTTVTWTNKDNVAHTVTETDGLNGPKSSDLNQNETYSFTYSSVGTFKYHCSIHPYMTGTVTVTN